MGNEYEGKYELERKSAKEWIKSNLRGEYTIEDTQEVVAIVRKGVNKVTSHSVSNITEEQADKKSAPYPRYRYYVVGLRIGGVDYTAKLTIGVDENGNKYYDHALTEIEKANLLDRINSQADSGFISTGAKPNLSVTKSKDSKLLSILQTDACKVVDENGEPMVEDHGANTEFDKFDLSKDVFSGRTLSS